MRYFNTHGPVNAEEHYVVSRQALLSDLLTQIESGKYFTIYAPRQMGKTTLLEQMVESLRTWEGYLPIPLSFELYENWSESRFLASFGDLICQHVKGHFLNQDHPQKDSVIALTLTPPTEYEAIWQFFSKLYDLVPGTHVVMIIDEFDATPQSAISSLLQVWRTMYLSQLPKHCLHSVILVGIQNIARLNFGRSSPFNIAYQHRLANFSATQVGELLMQFTEESGQGFDDGTIDWIHQQTGGQPFLVNRLAAILTEDVVTVRDRSLSLADLRVALQRLVRESNYNFETVVRRAAEYQEDVLRILFGASYAFTLNDPLVNSLYMYGIIDEAEAGFCAIANPIYKRVLIDYFRPRQIGLQAAILANGYDFRASVDRDVLQMRQLLSKFREFVERRGREAFKVGPTPQEATGQYLLMAYLDLAIRNLEGDLFTEVNSGEGRLDLLVTHQGRRYVVETKLWRGQLEYERGLAQLRNYLASEGQTTGYYVVFHALPNVYGKLNHEELEFVVEEKGMTIHVYLIRLGQIFE